MACRHPALASVFEMSRTGFKKSTKKKDFVIAYHSPCTECDMCHEMGISPGTSDSIALDNTQLKVYYSVNERREIVYVLAHLQSQRFQKQKPRSARLMGN